MRLERVKNGGAGRETGAHVACTLATYVYVGQRQPLGIDCIMIQCSMFLAVAATVAASQSQQHLGHRSGPLDFADSFVEYDASDT